MKTAPPPLPPAPLPPIGSAPAGGKRRFLAQFIRKPTEIGAIAPSSPYLADRMLEGVDLAKVRSIIEYGPGTGAFTKAILARLNALPAAQRPAFFAIEINEPLVRQLRARFPHLHIKHGSVTDVERFCGEESIELPDPRHPGDGSRGVDVIISGLPWASFSETLQRDALAAAVRVLKPGGRLITFGYHIGLLTPAGQRVSRILPEYFATVERSRPVWRNLPPAFVVRCVK